MVWWDEVLGDESCAEFHADSCSFIDHGPWEAELASRAADRAPCLLSALPVLS